VAEATGVSSTDAGRAVDAAGGDVKVAIVSLLTGLTTPEAAARLQAHDGVVRAAVEAE
jgi:N-acetylmuramic acid 6-phosphate etherase